MIKTGQVFNPFYKGTNKITLEGYNHLTWRYKIIPYIRTDNCVDMSNMFSGDEYSLPEVLDLRNFNTSHVTTMRSMFENNMSTSILGLDIFDTSNVEDMNAMFKGSKATALDLSSFNTSKVVDMGDMFCDSDVTSLDISSFDTSLVSNMSSLFENVSASIDVSNFDTSNVVNTHNMFKGTSGTTLDLTHFDMSNVTDMSGMFSNTNYEDIDYSTFDTSSVVNMENLFNGSVIETIDVSGFDMSNVTDISGMFGNIKPQTFVFPNTLDFSNVEDISNLFANAEIDTVDLTGMSFPSINNRKRIFYGLKADLLDISDWDLGDNVSTNLTQSEYEALFDSANIHEIRFSNANNFPEGYNVNSMFYHFKTDGVLDLSSFNFYKAKMSSSGGMLGGANINTLILPDLTDDSFDASSSYSYIYRLFGDNGASVELLDGTNTTISSKYGADIFSKLVATRINMPNWIVGDQPYVNTSYYGCAKYVDYSALDTRNMNYTSQQWGGLAGYYLKYTKKVWIPSTFVLDGERTISLSGDVYTDALSYTELGWQFEPRDAVMHYGATHADFEQAVLNDDPDDWVSPQGCKLFFCHTHVPLNSTLTVYQFDPRFQFQNTFSNYAYDVYMDDEPLEDGYVFDEVGTHVLKLVAKQSGYEYKQTITVVDHGSSYSIVGNPLDYTWDSTSRRYLSTASTKVECRLYPDNYLFIYPLGVLENSIGKYTVIESNPYANMVKISGVPFNINRINLSNSRQLNDISELIITTYGEHGFNPNSMFSGCTSLTDVSSLEQWNISTRFGYYYVSSNRVYTQYSRNTYSYIFSQCTNITSAPRVSFSGSSLFYGCTRLNDISKLKPFTSDGNTSDNSVSFNSLFRNCTSLSNVNRLKELFKHYAVTGSSVAIDLSYAFSNTKIANVDFIPEGVKIRSLASTFEGCTLLSDLTGLSRIVWANANDCTFSGAFGGIPATDYSPLANWSYSFRVISMFNTKISNLSFLSSWDLLRCVSYDFGSCTSLTSISNLSGKINTTTELSVRLSGCTALTSLIGLSGCILGTSYTSFSNCSSLTTLDGLQGCTFSYAESMFIGCSSLRDISVLREVTFTSSVTSINNMFNGCTSLTSLDGLQNIDVSNMTALVGVFSGCTALTNISAIAGWNPYQVKNINSLFYHCSSITSFASLQNWITGQLTNINQAFRGCSSLINLGGLMGFNVGQCTSLSYLFADCTALTDISDITLWYIGACTNLSYMFYNCSSLASVNPLKGWYVAKLTNMRYMFFGCTAIADASILEQWKNVKTMTSVSRTYAFRNVPTPWPTWAVS